MSKRSTLIGQCVASFASVKRAMHQCVLTSNAEFSPSQIEVLWHVSHHTDMSVKDLANMLQVTPSAVTQLIEPLTKSGSLLRNTDPADRRSVMLHVSPSGKKALADVSRQKTLWMAKILEPLSDEELETLHTLFDKLAVHKQNI